MVENGTLEPMQNLSPFFRQRMVVVASVLLLHVLVLWGLQSGLLQRVLAQAEELVVPVAFITPEPAPPPLVKPPVAPPKAAPQQPSTAVQKPSPTPAPAPPPAAPAPAPLAIADNSPASNAPVAAAPAPAAVAAPAAPAKLELPSSDAEYLHNPKSEYPRLSRQRNEQGRVLVSVYIGTDGTAQKAEVKVSSGFERLDQAALATVKSWRYVPGKRGGVPEAMWFTVPINFVLE